MPGGHHPGFDGIAGRGPGQLGDLPQPGVSLGNQLQVRVGVTDPFPEPP